MKVDLKWKAIVIIIWFLILTQVPVVYAQKEDIKSIKSKVDELKSYTKMREKEREKELFALRERQQREKEELIQKHAIERENEAFIRHVEKIITDLENTKRSEERETIIRELSLFIDRMKEDLGIKITNREQKGLLELSIRALGAVNHVKIIEYKEHIVENGDSLWNLGRSKLVGVNLERSASLWMLLFLKNKDKNNWALKTNYRGYDYWVLIEPGELIEIPYCTYLEK